jgi:sucrose phosphorylase
MASKGKMRQLRARIRAQLERVYGTSRARRLVTPLIEAMRYGGTIADPLPYLNRWDETDVWIITYAGSIHEPGRPGLQSLLEFMDRYFADSINGVHVLPFFPYSSDDGFAVIDYFSVDKSAGSWKDVRAIADRYRLMADLVINHASSQSQWFRNFIARKDPGKDYFKEASPEDDLSQVVRPRSTPLRNKVQTADGERWVWCTFGPDQIDFDFSNPEVLLRFVEIIHHYLANGIRVLRLDAVAFLWKEPGTSSLHDQRTHEIVKLLRTLVEHYDPQVMLITETNVPNRDNLTYFGNANEAHAIYNFSLPPLLIHTLLTGDCRHLKTWIMSMPPARNGTAYLNFIASHDGIGLRPADGLLSASEMTNLLETLTSFGGRISIRTGPDGQPHPYEVNISLLDALSGTIKGPDEHRIARFVCAHAIMLSLEGIPAIYIHSLLATPNDLEAVAETGRSRSINRHVWPREEIEALLSNKRSTNSIVFRALCDLLMLRRRQKAFHPNAIQFTLHLGLEFFGVWRQSMDREQDIFCISNVTDRQQSLALENVNLVSTVRWRDLVSGLEVSDGQREILLEPYQTIWLSNA